MRADEDPQVDVNAPATGTAGRVGLSLAVVLAAAALIWWLWPDHGRGEREQAHRVLIVGGTPSDLGAAIAEAGFEGEQRTWADTDREVAAVIGRFDDVALLDYADERGYGFVAVMFGDDYPWGESLLGRPIPDHANAAVISVGELAGEDGPSLRFAGPPKGLAYAAGVERGEGLRLALYEHPDLLALWDDPTPDQQAQQVHLGKLADARTLLARAQDSYARALSAWPELPPGSLGGPWQELRGLPVAGGLLVELVDTRVVVDERRQLERAQSLPRALFVGDATLLQQGDPLAAATELPVEVPRAAWRSQDGRWLLAGGYSGERHRYEVTGSGLVERALEHDEGFSLAISNDGRLALQDDDAVVTELGTIEFGRLSIVAAAWLGDQLALALMTPTIAEPDIWARYLVIVRPVRAGAPPLLVIDPDSLLAAAAADTARVTALYPTGAGLYLIVEYREDEGKDLRALVRLRVPESLPEPDLADAPILTGELLAARVRSAAELEPITLGLLPYTEEFDVAPDGRWIAWRALGTRGTVRAAPIVGDALGPEIEIDDGTGGRSLPGPLGPLFTADGRAIVFADALPTGLSEAQDAPYAVDPWTAEFLRVVALPSSP